MTSDEETWGATHLGEGHWRIATWAPGATALRLHLGDATHEMDPRPNGWHVTEVSAAAGTAYDFERDGRRFADPAAMSQDGDVHARSLLVDRQTLAADDGWVGRDWESAVILELHVGTFTDDGTLTAAADRLKDLADLGITAVELMPLGQFAGDRGWGYDVVLPFALHPAYGSPEDMAAFTRRAHELGLMVLVDAVYNHFGPEGAVLHDLCPAFFDRERHTPWGAAIDFDCPEVRAYFLQNSEMWIRDYGVDGLRLDAVHQIGAPGDTRFVTTLGERMAALDLGRPVHIVTEDERNLVEYVEVKRGIRAQWNDDYHHAVHCLLTGERQSYYAPFAEDPFGDIVTALRDGQIDQGQIRPGQDEPRGELSGHLPPQRFVNANQTHDQIGNRAFGDRLLTLTDPETMQVMHAMLLLAPFVPMLFMGEEAGSRAPFLFFTDFHGDLADAVRKGRRSEFPEFADARSEIPDPNAPETFRASRPYSEPPEDAESWRALTRECLDLRHEHVVPLLRDGWRDAHVERVSPGTLRARWSFDGGALGLCLTTEGALPDLPENAPEIFRREAPRGLALAVGAGATT